MRRDLPPTDSDAIATVDEQLFYLYDELWATGDTASALVVQEMMDSLAARSTNSTESGTSTGGGNGETTTASG